MPRRSSLSVRRRDRDRGRPPGDDGQPDRESGHGEGATQPTLFVRRHRRTAGVGIELIRLFQVDSSTTRRSRAPYCPSTVRRTLATMVRKTVARWRCRASRSYRRLPASTWTRPTRARSAGSSASTSPAGSRGDRVRRDRFGLTVGQVGAQEDVPVGRDHRRGVPIGDRSTSTMPLTTTPPRRNRT